MFTLLIDNLMLIGVLAIMYLVSVFINTVLGMYSNVAEMKQSFSWEKVRSGLSRAAILLVGALVITALITLLPEILAIFGITAETAIIESISVIAMATVMGSAILRYLKDAVTKFFNILGVKVKEEQ